ncbi:MAG: radical SAM protein [Planctomycetota bacterium]|jgi:radical SAM protein with 4Fe4S-binding SPASM domain
MLKQMIKETYITRPAIDKVSLWKDKVPLLLSLDMELTERCNSDCIHCCINLPAGDLDVEKRELSTDRIKEILKESVALGCLRVRFTGGEPLLREDFRELYIFARRLGLKVLLFTNATLITPGLAELFASIPPLERIEITVYGLKKGSHEAVTRTRGLFEAAQRGINLLLEHKVPFVVKGVFLPSNKREIDEFEAWVAKIPCMDKPPSYSMFFDLRCRRDDIDKNELIRKLRVAPGEGLGVLARREKDYLKTMQGFCSKFTRPFGDKLFSCASGQGGGCVDAYGYYQPCLMLRHPDAVYDLNRGSLKDALINFFPKLRKIKATNPEYLSRCAVCFLKGLCEQCPAKSWMEHGTLDTPVDYLCKITHTQARYLGLLGKRELSWEVKDWKRRIDLFINQ